MVTPIIIVVIGLLLAFVTGFFCATKAIQIGLRWRLQTDSKQSPTLDSPIQPIINTIHQSKADELSKYSKDQMKEWMYGE